MMTARHDRDPDADERLFRAWERYVQARDTHPVITGEMHRDPEPEDVDPIRGITGASPLRPR
jgi:hypothetical protein